MIYSPHTLFIRTTVKGAKDDDGYTLPDTETWTEVCPCRCDDNGVMKQVSVNGKMYDYSYHVVYEGEKIPAGTYVKIMDGEEVRGEGEVLKSAKCNYLSYAGIWL